ncbi:hypothetical protein PG997_006649 [Apiospora hydei]|uniref:BTB domain-containing protein n=1 Tax=Apiospora hydei TaxID=1337664 RepID=A0ABR1WPD3_9PEZI
MKYSAIGSDRFTDAVVKCDGQTWPIHRVIVCRESEWFAKAFCGNFKEATTQEIDIHDIDPSDVEKVLRYIYYDGELSGLDSGGLIGLLTLARAPEDPAANISPEEPTYASQLIALYRLADYFAIALRDEVLARLQRYLTTVARDVQHRYLAKVTGFKTDKKRMQLFEPRELDSVLRGAADAFRYGLDKDDALQRAFTAFVNDTCYIALAGAHFIRRVGKAPDFAVAILQERHLHGGWPPTARYAPAECEVCREGREAIFGGAGIGTQGSGRGMRRFWAGSRCQGKLDEHRREEARAKKMAAATMAGG